MISILLTTLPIGIQDTAADPLKDIDEEDTLEVTSQTSPIAQVFIYLPVLAHNFINVA